LEGHEVYFLVNTYGYTEDHSLVVPTILGESFFSELVGKFFRNRAVNRQWYFPRFVDLWIYLYSLRPNVTIIRVHGRVFNLAASIFLSLLGSRLVFYEQVGPLRLQTLHNGTLLGIFRRLIFFARLYSFNAVWITPIPSRLDCPGQLPQRCFFLPFAVHVSPIRQANDVEKPTMLLTIGKYQERKNHAMLLHVLSKLSLDLKIQCTMVGEVVTPEQRCQRAKIELLVRQHDLDDTVVFLDNVPHADIAAVYKTHDIFVLPATREPASISVLEALGAGLPVVCSETCGTSSYVRYGVTGFTFTDGCHDSLYIALRNILLDENLWRRMSAQARIDAMEFFSGAAYYEKLKEIIQLK